MPAACSTSTGGSRSRPSRRCCSTCRSSAPRSSSPRIVDPPIVALAWGVPIGGVLQLALQLPPAREDRDARAAALRLARRRRAARAGGDGTGGDRRVGGADLGAHQYAARASALGDGRISWITYADRLMEFPSALLGVALGTVLLPSLAKSSRRREPGAVHRRCSIGACASRSCLRCRRRWRCAVLADSAHCDAVSVRALHRERRAADARRAPGLQRRTARAHRREDPGPGLLRATGHGDAREDRVHDGPGVANVRGHPDVSDGPRGSDAVDVDRRVPQRGAACSGS